MAPSRSGRPAESRSHDASTGKYVRRRSALVWPLLVALSACGALSVGWINSDEGHLTPESGTGYWLGIVGAAAMLLLLIYPLRKRAPRLRFLGSVRFWFKSHMLLGIVGPMLIIFHSNFKLGALNSNVAFIVMLVVAFSGVVGRYIYGKIHLGLNTRKADLRAILDDAAQIQKALGNDLVRGSSIIAQMNDFAIGAMTPRTSLLRALVAVAGHSLRTTAIQRRLRRQLHVVIADEALSRGMSRKQRREREAEVRDLLALYFMAMSKAAKFGLYERLFGLWHLLHLPLFVLLIASALIHVFAVHFY